jgi:subtilisin family serine protease
MLRLARSSRHLCLTVLLVLPRVATGQDLLTKDPAGKLSSALFRIAELAERGEPLSATSLRTARGAWRFLDRATNRVTAVAVLTPDADRARLEARVTAASGAITGRADNLMRVQLPPRALLAFSRDPDVGYLRLPFRPHSTEVTSEGVATIGAADFVARTGADGSGVRVGVIDGLFEGAESLIGSELPADTIFTDSAKAVPDPGTALHGTACAEIVHDVAPGAQLVLASVDDDVEFVQAINQLLDQGVKVVSASIAWPNQEPLDGSGYFAFQVEKVAARGVLWVNAAGNYTDQYLRCTATDTDANGRLELHGLEMVPFHAYAGEGQVSLLWNEDFGRAAEDYDLLVVTDAFRDDPRPSADNPAVIGVSANPQNGAGYPYEWVDFQSDSDRDLFAVVIDHGKAPGAYRKFSLWVDGTLPASLASPVGSLATPADARSALTVGAVDAGTRELRGFSSRGPTDDGRVKPDVAGPDGVSTTSYYWKPFLGTSAATPHVAGAAALLWSRDPTLSLAALRDALQHATASRGATQNNDVGFGLVDLSLVR